MSVTLFVHKQVSLQVHLLSEHVQLHLHLVVFKLAICGIHLFKCSHSLSPLFCIAPTISLWLAFVFLDQTAVFPSSLWMRKPMSSEEDNTKESTPLPQPLSNSADGEGLLVYKVFGDIGICACRGVLVGILPTISVA